jgi:hypothetical protein
MLARDFNVLAIDLPGHWIQRHAARPRGCRCRPWRAPSAICSHS